MSDPNKFPSVEPPPSPLGQNQNVTSPTTGNTIPGQPAMASNLELKNKFAKKGVPKPLLYALIAGIVVIAVSFLLIAFRSGGSNNLVGTEGEITWWGLQNEEAIVAPLIAEFERQNNGVKVNYVKQSPQDYRERLTNALASGKGPDIFEIHNTWQLMYKNDLAPIPENVMSRQEFTQAFYPIMTTDLVSAEGPIAMPLEYDALTLFINEDIFTSALKSPPTTWDDLASTARDLTQRGPNRLIIQSGVALGLTENIDHWPEIVGLMLYQNGADPAKLQENVVRDVLTFFLKFNLVDKVWDTTQPQAQNAFARGRLAMYFGTTRDIQSIVEENPDLRFRTVPLPQLPKERPNDPDFAYATYWAQGVWRRSKNADIAWKLLKYLSSPDSLIAMNQSRSSNDIPEKAYPRPEMAAIHKDDPALSSLYVYAPDARSWYLASDANDGQTGLNSQVNTVFKETIQVFLDNQDIGRSVKALPAKVSEVVGKFSNRRR